MAFEWYEPPTLVFAVGAQQYTQAIENGILAIVEQRTPEVTAWMRATHPWQNRTGDAEAGLHTAVEHAVRSMITLHLAHGAEVSYGIWLEVANQGRFAIIAPAVDYWGETLWADVQRMMRG